MTLERAGRPYVDRPIVDLEAAEKVARVAAKVWGIGDGDLRLLRLGMNALFIVGDTVIRVGKSTAQASLSHDITRVMIAHGIRTVTPVDGLTADIGTYSVTGWEVIREVRREIDWEVVGAAVRHVHEVATTEIPTGYPVPSPVDFPWWDFDRMFADAADLIDRPAMAGLRAKLDRHAGWQDRVAGDAVVCHGDVHPGNVMVAAGGPRLIDWDLLCWASSAWDHAMLSTYASRWGGSLAAYRAFKSGYGPGVDDELAAALGELRNIAATLLRIDASRTQPAAAREAEQRLRYWRGDPDAPIWQAQ